MRKTALAAVAALSLAGATGTAALAQPAPPPPGGPGAMQPPATAPEPTPLPTRRMEWMRDHGRWGHGWAMRHGPMRSRPFGLFFPTQDKHLSPADVGRIAQALLLWHGNHAWRVVDVQPAPADEISFAYATPDGFVIARFEMNQQTGRITRTG